MADLPSILGGMAQGFIDFGKGAVDLFGTGGAAIGDLVDTIKTGKVSTKNQDDFRKWLYDTNDVQDAAAKGLGTALNGVQTVTDYIPGIGAVTKNPLFNAGQGALGGLADEFKTYGKDYDLGRAGERAAVSAGGALASTGLADALKGSSNGLLKSATAQGLGRGAIGGAITGGGYAAIDGGDVLEAAKQGAGMGALIGGATGAVQDFTPRKATYDMALTDEEKAARIANAKNMLANEQNPERIAELNNQINYLGGGLDGAQNYRTFATGDEAREYFSKSNPAYWDGLPSSVDEGIQEYTRNGYSRVNDMLRTGQDNYGYPDTDVLIGDIERGIEGYNLPDDIKVYRRSAADAYKNLGVGDTFTDEGFTSTSISPNIGGDFGKANIEINVGNGKGVGAFIGDLSSGNGDEGEFLLQRGTKYKVLGRGQDGTLQLEVVGNERRPLEQILSASDAAVNSPRYITDENGNPRTLYHGSPNANITEFDIGQAGKNTRSGERAIYFTDSPEVADEFSYERIPTDDLFVENRGAKGRVYPVNLEMNNPLDLDNLTDAQIEELWPYASYMGSWQGKDVFTRDLKNWRDVNNAQLIKGYLDMDKLAGSPYDGFMARMYPNQDNQAREYAVFDNSKVKMLEDVLANDDMAVNSAKIAPGQLGLFDDTPTQTPKTGARQTSLFDQPQEGVDYYGDDIEMPATEPSNPYAPVDGQVTQAMRDRAADILGNWKKNGVPENELYNAINPDTLPLGYKEAIDVLDNMDAKKYLKDNLGVTDIKKAKFDKVLDYLFGDNEDAKRARIEMRDQQIESAKQKAKLLGLPGPSKNFVPTVEAQLREEVEYKMAKDISKSLKDIPVDAQTGEVMPLTAKNLERLDPKKHSFRTGYTAAADEAFSERLGIAPGNTPKYNGRIDVRGAYGRYSHPMYGVGGDLAIFERKIDNPEDAISSVAHERLHSFQNETTNSANNAGRYSKEVEDAFKDLRKDLEQHYKSWDETAKRYGGGRGNVYWNSVKEQEARMLETYLQNKGYADAPEMKSKYRAGEWGNEINPAFDKFFDKLRDLSKRGVALPAITALLGGGAYMASQDKDKEAK